jgi:hypothetical protein
LSGCSPHLTCTCCCISFLLCCFLLPFTVSGFLSAKSCLTAGHTSPNSSALGKRKHQTACKNGPVEALQAAGHVSGVPIRAHNAADSWAGRRVLVYWPADNQWWEATLCRVSAGWLVLALLDPRKADASLLEQHHRQAAPSSTRV